MTASCQPPSVPGPGAPVALGSGAKPTLPRTADPGFCTSAQTYGQLRRKTARPSWNARRVSSSAEAITERGDSPLVMVSRSQPSPARASSVSSAMRPPCSSSPPWPQMASKALQLSPSYWRPCQRKPDRRGSRSIAARAKSRSSAYVLGARGTRSVRK